jgi:hypothetical protein
MPLLGILVAVPLFSLFALLGRWVQLHPEKIVSKGHFAGENTFGARLFRIQVACLGTFIVFCGTWCALFALLHVFTFDSVVLQGIVQFAAIGGGIIAAMVVRKEANARPRHVSDNPFGWWP